MARKRNKRSSKRGKTRFRWTDIVFIIGIVSSLSVLLYLNLADLYAQYVAETHISEMDYLYSDKNDPARLEYERQAHLFNERLSGKDPEGDILDYKDQLFYRQEPMISHIEIPKISVKLPIYHGVEDNVLMAGVGHWETSSLPIGGETSHCVLMGHSGMRNTRMFDDLHKLEVGDKFVIWTLGDPYAYEIYDIETVLPEEVAAKIKLISGKDLVTLVTCTPYGVNTHRLLVHAVKCEYTEDIGRVGIDAYVNDRNLPLLLAGALAILLAIAAGAEKSRRNEKRRKKEVSSRKDRRSTSNMQGQSDNRKRADASSQKVGGSGSCENDSARKTASAFPGDKGKELGEQKGSHT